MDFDFQRYGSAFLDKYLHGLRVLITDQSDRLFEFHDIRAPSPCISVVLFLDERRRANITQIASALGYSHQLINQRLSQLERLKLVRRYRDVKDRRKSLLTLTPAGKAEAEKMRSLLPRIAEAFDALFVEENANLPTAISSVSSALEEKSLAERISNPKALKARIKSA